MQPAVDQLEMVLRDTYALHLFLFSLMMVVGIFVMTAASTRSKHQATAVSEQICILALTIVSTFLFGWWIRQLFVAGPGLTGGVGAQFYSALPWNQDMAPAASGDRIATPRPEWLHHLLASWLVAALLALSVAERVRATSLLLLGVLAGCVCSSIAAAWMWSSEGWLVRLTGFHDAFGAAAVHTIAGGFSLGVLQVVGARKAAETNATVSAVPTANPWLSCVGHLFLISGLIAFSAGVSDPVGVSDVRSATGAYGTPAPMFGIVTNLLMAVAAGLLVGHVMSSGDPHGSMSAGVAGLVAVSAGGDLYHPLQALLIAAVVSWLSTRFAVRMRVRYALDDASDIVANHGFAGALGLIFAGVVLWTAAASGAEDNAFINPFGNVAGAVVAFFLLGQLPGYVAGRFLNYLGALRTADIVEIAGRDLMAEVRATEAARRSVEREHASASDLLIEDESTDANPRLFKQVAR